MDSRTEFESLSAALEQALDLRLPPVAVCFTERAPESVARFDGRVPAGCAFWELGAHRAFATRARDHELCSIGVHTHQLADASPRQPEELRAALEAMTGLDYVRPEEVGAIPVLEDSPRNVVYAPLARAPLAPDVVLLFAHAKQGLVISEAVQRTDGAAAPAMGRPACAVIAQARNSGRAALSLGCCGARAYIDAMSDDVALWALPGPRLAEYVAHISALAAANTTLRRFHQLRRRDVEDGASPSVAQSLERLQNTSD
jgi:uncharacterized protein (DUF169 family)